MSGGKTVKSIDNLAPCHPYKFRIQVILKDTGVHKLSKRALQHYGSEEKVYYAFNSRDDAIKTDLDDLNEAEDNAKENTSIGELLKNVDKFETCETSLNSGMASSGPNNPQTTTTDSQGGRWIESQWSIETWSSTETDGTSAVCFCMAVRCGYLKQVQLMLEERPSLIDILNSTNGLTPLCTAVRQGNITMVKFLLNNGADVNNPCSGGQLPLHLAVYAGHLDIADQLLDKGANFQMRDINGLRVEHYAVDSGNLDSVLFILEKGGDISVRDNKGWTPLFRAVIQGASSEIVQTLVNRGSDISAVDQAGLSVATCASLLRAKGGCGRDSILRLVDAQYSHDKAVANFARLTKKISSVQYLFK